MLTTTLPPFRDDREIIIANTKGQWEQITATAADEQDAAWSPDGTKIAFTVVGGKGCTAGGQQRRFSDIYVANPDGSQRQLITGGLPYDWRIEDWGTSGILANAGHAGASGVLTDPCPAPGPVAHLVAATGATATPLLGDLRDRALALSPDETAVLLTRGSGQDDSVWVTDLDGSNPVRIATNTYTADWAADLVR